VLECVQTSRYLNVGGSFSHGMSLTSALNVSNKLALLMHTLKKHLNKK